MLLANWEKVIDLVKNTGEHCLVFDGERGDGFVVMGLSEYEKMVKSDIAVKGLTEDQLLDRINQDIALWQSTNQSNLDNIWDSETKIKAEAVENEEKYYIEPVE